MALRRVERAGSEATDTAAIRADLLGAVADSAMVIRSPLSPDHSERLRPGSIYDATCQQAILADRAGTWFLPPVMLSRRADLTFVRDLGARDSVLRRAAPSRAAYLLAPASSAADAPLRFVRLPPEPTAPAAVP